LSGKIGMLHLVLRESLYGGSKVMLSICAVIVAVGSLVGALTLFKVHELRTQSILRTRAIELQGKVDVLNDDVRKAMLKLGFNIVILPKDQNLADFYSEDYAAKDMPEEYVTKLAKSKIVTVQHVLPSLQQKIEWPEMKRRIILMGTRGELSSEEPGPKRPMVEPVPKGKIVLGYELHNSLGLKTNDTVALMGREFTVYQCHAARGTKDDITAWIHLAEAQSLLEKPGKINAIMALECKCAWADLAKVRKEITKILPDTQVIERSSEALARAEARQQVEEQGKAAIEQERAGRDNLKRERERLASIVVPLVMIVCAVWIAFMVFTEGRERRLEIGILRAIGVRTRQVLALFLTKAVVVGLIGGIMGVLAGFGVGLYLSAMLKETAGLAITVRQVLPRPALIIVAFSIAPVLSLLASWIPAIMASQEDPAVILRDR
jgi:putative ABC transport system permease protein